MPRPQVHAVQTNEIFLLVGEVMAQIAAAFADGSSTSNGLDGDDDSRIAAARSPFADFVQEPWWDVAVPRDDSSTGQGANAKSPCAKSPCNGNGGGEGAVADRPCDAAGAAVAASLPDTLRALCEESSALLRSAFALALGPLPAPLERALSAERFGRVVGMFEQNNVGVRRPSPIPGILREVLSEEAEEEEKSAGGADRLMKDGGVEASAERRDFLLEAAGLVEELAGEEGWEEEECSEEGDGGTGGCCGGGPTPACPSSAAGCAAGGEKAAAAGTACPAAAAASPGGDHAEEDEEEDDGAGEALAILRSVVDGDGGSPEGGEDLFAPLDGTALYSLICCMNHSCRPNCLVRYPGRRRPRHPTATVPTAAGLEGSAGGDDDRLADAPGAAAGPLLAEVVLLEDVSEREELTQSYVTREMGLSERRKALEDYGFWCNCPRCLEEEARG